MMSMVPHATAYECFAGKGSHSSAAYGRWCCRRQGTMAALARDGCSGWHCRRGARGSSDIASPAPCKPRGNVGCTPVHCTRRARHHLHQSYAGAGRMRAGLLAILLACLAGMCVCVRERVRPTPKSREGVLTCSGDLCQPFQPAAIGFAVTQARGIPPWMRPTPPAAESEHACHESSIPRPRNAVGERGAARLGMMARWMTHWARRRVLCPFRCDRWAGGASTTQQSAGSCSL